MRTIRLELLRHGPPHNQLLSPLTKYLALCANHPPVEVHVPFEQHEFAYRLRGLHYSNGIEGSRTVELNSMGRVIAGILGQIPGLIAELNRGDAGQPVHLRLILSASELALIPFELTYSFEGLPAAGLPLLLQSEVPVCLTREVRRSREEGRSVKWRSPRILFAWANAPGFDKVPHEEHRAALLRAVKPWEPIGTDEPGNLVSELGEATLRDIEEACQREQVRFEGGFTHVHILAHGVQRKGDRRVDTEYGLAFSDGAKGCDVVVGGRLATALGISPYSPTSNASMVTIASCYGSAQGALDGPVGPAGAGASVAHSLHLAAYRIPINCLWSWGRNRFALRTPARPATVLALIAGSVAGHQTAAFRAQRRIFHRWAEGQALLRFRFSRT